jgi:hypothetical protein
VLRCTPRSSASFAECHKNFVTAFKQRSRQAGQNEIQTGGKFIRSVAQIIKARRASVILRASIANPFSR